MRRGTYLAAGAAIVAVVAFMVLRRPGAEHAVTPDQAQAGLDRVLRSLPSGMTVHHGATDYDTQSHTLTVHDFLLSQDGKPVLTAATLTLADADFDALRDVFEPAAYPNGHPAWTERRRLIGYLDAAGLDLTVSARKPVTVHAARIRVDDLRGRPFALPPNRANSGTEAFRRDAWMAFSTGPETIDGMAAALPDGNARLTVERASEKSYDSGKISELEYRNIAIDAKQEKADAPSVHFAIGRFAMDGVDITGTPLPWTEGGHFPRTAFSALRYRTLDLSSAVLTLDDSPVVSLQSSHTSVDYGNNGSVDDKTTVRAIVVSAKGQKLTAQQEGLLKAFGTDTLTTDIDAADHWEPATKTLTIKGYDWTLRDMGKLHLEAETEGLSVQDLSDQTMAAYGKLVLHSATLRWDDASLANRIIAVAALQMHTTPESLRAQLSLPLATLGVMLPDQPDAGAQVMGFLNNPKSLTITLAPPERVTLAQIGEAPMTSRGHLLGLHVSGKR